MDLDDQELWYTQIGKKLLKKEELKTMRKDYIEQLNKTTDNKEKKNLINRINKIDKELGEIER